MDHTQVREEKLIEARMKLHKGMQAAIAMERQVGDPVLADLMERDIQLIHATAWQWGAS